MAKKQPVKGAKPAPKIPPAKITPPKSIKGIPSPAGRIGAAGMGASIMVGTAPRTRTGSLGTRGNSISLSEAVRAVQYPESNSPETRKYYTMKQTERETVWLVEATGGDKNFWFPKQQEASGDEEDRKPRPSAAKRDGCSQEQNTPIVDNCWELCYYDACIYGAIDTSCPRSSRTPNMAGGMTEQFFRCVDTCRLEQGADDVVEAPEQVFVVGWRWDFSVTSGVLLPPQGTIPNVAPYLAPQPSPIGEIAGTILGAGGPLTLDLNLEVQFAPHFLLPQYWGQEYFLALVANVSGGVSWGSNVANHTQGIIFGMQSWPPSSTIPPWPPATAIIGGDVDLPWIQATGEADLQLSLQSPENWLAFVGVGGGLDPAVISPVGGSGYATVGVSLTWGSFFDFIYGVTQNPTIEWISELLP